MRRGAFLRRRPTGLRSRVILQGIPGHISHHTPLAVWERAPSSRSTPLAQGEGVERARIGN